MFYLTIPSCNLNPITSFPALQWTGWKYTFQQSHTMDHNTKQLPEEQVCHSKSKRVSCGPKRLILSFYSSIPSCRMYGRLWWLEAVYTFSEKWNNKRCQERWLPADRYLSQKSCRAWYRHSDKLTVWVALEEFMKSVIFPSHCMFYCMFLTQETTL